MTFLIYFEHFQYEIDLFWFVSTENSSNWKLPISALFRADKAYPGCMDFFQALYQRWKKLSQSLCESRFSVIRRLVIFKGKLVILQSLSVILQGTLILSRPCQKTSIKLQNLAQGKLSAGRTWLFCCWSKKKNPKHTSIVFWVLRGM